MHSIKRRHDAAFKAKVGLEAMKEEKTTAQIASEYSVHPNQIRQWKKQILESLPAVFSDRRPRKERPHQALDYRTPYEVYFAKERGIHVIPNAN